MSDVFVVVPRASMAKVRGLNWQEVVQMAEDKQHGLSMQPGERTEQGILRVPPSKPDHAFLYHGDDEWGRDKALLFVQEWRE